LSKVADFCHFGVVTQVVRDEPRASVSFFHADAQCFERPADHPARMGVQLGSDGASQCFDAFHEGVAGSFSRLLFATLSGAKRKAFAKRRETGKESRVQVSYDEGVAIHIGPESCAVAREGFGEALGYQPGESQGQMGGYAIRTV
jgi:hypothetical protein